MNGKLSQLFLLILVGILLWQWLGPKRRQEMHRTIKISAGVLLTFSVIALLIHQYHT